MSAYDIFLGTVLTSTIITAITIITIKVHQHKKDRLLHKLPKNPNIVINFLAKKTNNHAVGFELPNIIYGKNNRAIASFLPIDIKPREEDELPDYKVQKVVIDNGKRRILPKGTLSAHHNVVLYLPKTANELDFLQDEIGNILKREVTAQNVYNDTLQSVINGYSQMAKISKELAMGELRAESLEWLKSMVKNLQELSNGEKTYDKPIVGNEKNI